MAAATKIFLTGASGYIGGEVLHALRKANPSYLVSALVRDEAKGATISKAYPEVRIVLGDLDSASLVEEEATNTDIVIHAASTSHIKSVEAIARGLARRQSYAPAHWLQISGASVLSITDIVQKRFGQGNDEVFSDVDDADKVRDIITQNAGRRVVDDFILKVAGPKTALIFPPIIYGQGQGPVSQRSVQIPELSRVAIQTGAAVRVGKGESTWSNVHIADVSDVFVKLVEKAVQGENNGLWNKDGLYFVGNTAVSFGDISQKVAQAAKDLGLIESAEVKELSPEEADKLSGHGSVLWGTNAKQNSQRARQLLGWEPKGISLEQEVPQTVQVEAARLGKL
ncbi:NAD(P)-binding protein [Aspergillus pseudoustus]|uniref:NAD(P)-binding protein n=1 Tax=Aspergillus pseudoustus TaxID=1810923 RepID=A0ABR4JEZ9_9EURO